MALDPQFQAALSAFAQELGALKRQVKLLQYGARQSQLGNSSIDNSALTVTAGGTTRSVIGMQPDGTVTTVDQNAPPPPTPSTPAVAVIVNGISVSWDGTFVNGAAQPLDFRDIEVHVSTVSGFTPSQLTLEAVLLKAGTAQVVPLSPNFTYYVIIRAINSSGVSSTPSPQVSITYNTSLSVGAVATQGALTGVSIVDSTIVGAVIQAAALSNSSITQAAITQGTILEPDIVFDSTGGRLRAYGSTTTTVSYTTPGTYMWTCPAGVYAVKVECEGSDAGGGGGNANWGGEAGGGAEYAQEPAYPVVPGNVYIITVPAAGQGGSTNNAGTSGAQASFDGSGVVAGGGIAGINFVGGPGGNISTNTIHWPGGAGGSNPSGQAGAAGGGGRAGSTGPGGNGNNSFGPSGASGGAAGTGTGGLAGGAGGASQAPGSNGGGGGGAGNAPGGSGQATYDPTETQSFFGSGGLRNTDGDCYQNYSSGNPGGDGDQFSRWYYNAAQIASDMAGKTITGCNWNVQNLHTWYNSGAYAVIGYSNVPGGYATGQIVSWFNEGTDGNVNLGSGIGAAFAANSGAVEVLLGPAGSVGQAGNQYYYGYWATNSGALTLYYATVGSETAGSGSNGSVKLTYTSSSTPIAAIAGSAGTDPASSDTYGPGVTLWPQTGSPPSPVTGALLYGSPSATPAAVLPSGVLGTIPVTQVDTTQYAYSSTGVGAISNAWPIGAGDMHVGTKYTIKAYGAFAGWLSGSQNQYLQICGSSFNITGNSVWTGGTTGHICSWYAEVQATVLTVDPSTGSLYVGGFMIVYDNSAGGELHYMAFRAAPGSLSTTAATTMTLQYNFGTTGGTIQTFSNEFIRSGT